MRPDGSTVWTAVGASRRMFTARSGILNRMLVRTIPAAVVMLLIVAVPRVSADGPTTAPTTSPLTNAPPERLQFRLVVDDAPASVPADDLPDPSDATGQARLHVLREVVADGTDVSGVHLENHQDANDLTIIIEMKPDGADRLGAATEANVGRRLAVVLEGKLVVAPMIMGRIADRVAISQANPNDDQLMRLAHRLNDFVARRVPEGIPATQRATAATTRPTAR